MPIVTGDGKRFSSFAACDALQGLDGGAERDLGRAAGVVAAVAEDREEAVAEILQHLAALILDRRDEAVEIIVQELDGLSGLSFEDVRV